MINIDVEPPPVAGLFENPFSEKKIRMAFIRKVYGILMVQLAINAAIVSIFMFEENVKEYAFKNVWIIWVCFLGIIILILSMTCVEKVRKTFPLNFIVLLIFTLLESILLGMISSTRSTHTILLAAAICCVVCSALTIFAFQTKIDFTMRSGLLFVMLIVLLTMGILAAFIRTRTVQLIYGGFGALVFSMYLVYDTQMIIGGNHADSISPEDYILAVLSIYLDIINLFLMILKLLDASE